MGNRLFLESFTVRGHNMKKCLLILSLTCFAGTTQAGLKNIASDRTKSILLGVGILGHLGFNAMSAYFQFEQIGFLNKIPYPDNELGVSEEDKQCGALCQEDSKYIRDSVYRGIDVDGIATATSVISALFNLAAFSTWIAMMAHKNDRTNYLDKVTQFERVALGASVLNAALNVYTTGSMLEIVTHHISEIPLRTVAPLQVAIYTGVGYWLPMFLFGGYGIARLGKAIEDIRTSLKVTIVPIDIQHNPA